ncbi:LysR family transcriptional regulator [Ensifer sp. ENS02]|uniref:LysR family transcriptional regulator n=1 Tax=Ensifer sp. ENS02 TaxID=2769290 RepID=UPI001FEFDA61|nr:LysR family transcriptional regulator [Ensifer sp. ENS02]
MSSDHFGELHSQMSATRLPPLAALRCFEAAARLESFSRAADALHLTHGAISRAVRLIEDELGVALFERRSRRVFLTEAGRKLAAAVREGFVWWRVPSGRSGTWRERRRWWCPASRPF